MVSGRMPTRCPATAGDPKISCRQITTKVTRSNAASDATPIDTATSNRLPATTPVASSPIAISMTERTMPNLTTRELHSPD
jgi:hypothetical protein